MSNNGGQYLSPLRRLRAARRYARLVRLYPRAHRQVFGEQMRQTFRDHYRDAVERRGLPVALAAVLVMLHAMRHAVRLSTTPEPGSTRTTA